MRHGSLSQFIAASGQVLAAGPVALILAEDGTALEETVTHHLRAGFRQVVLFAGPALQMPDLSAPNLHIVDMDVLAQGNTERIVNAVIGAAPGIWLYYCYNAEFLFHPFCEHRSIGELLSFVTEERRESVLTFVIDLYAGDLAAHPDAVSLTDAYLDRSGYHALARTDRDKKYKERQLDFFGGFRWRFEEHVPPNRRRIDRVGLFRARAGLALQADHTFNIEEYNTYACPWHNSPTAAICSFRAAKALKRNPGSTYDIQTFRWHNSTRFEWQSQQLLNLGLMEPGQWF